MKNNSKAAAKRTQVVYDKPQWTKVGEREKLCKSGETVKTGVYKFNPDAKPIRTIVHPLIPGSEKHKAFNQFSKFKNR